MPINIGSKKPADFRNPLGLLTDCHRRIEYFLSLLVTIAGQSHDAPPDSEQRAALEKALQYFKDAAPKHTLDEEESLFPRLRLMPDPRARSVFDLLENLSAGHGFAEEMHRKIELLFNEWLSTGAISANDRRDLRDMLANLSAFYGEHIAAEERQLFPLAALVLTTGELQLIGGEMADRRGIRFPSPE